MQNQIIKGFRLAPQQRRVWSLQQDGSAYCVQGAVLLEGNLQPEILKDALQKVVNQQEILRTAFRHFPGIKTPVMVIADNSSLSLRTINLSDLELKGQETKIESLFLEQRHQDFDLEQGLILHSVLLKLSVNRHILMVSFPSLCGDAWTLKNLVSEINNAYLARLQTEELSEKAVQYVQFSEWQNQILEDDDAEAGKEYWEQQDFSNASRLKLPFESKSWQQSQFTPNCHSMTLGSDLLRKIETLVQQYDTSASIVLLTCWQILLWRVTGLSDIVVGTIYDRREGEYEPLRNVLGLLATWLPIKVDFAPDLRFIEALKLVKKVTGDAEEWQDYFCSNYGTVPYGTVPVGFESIEWSKKRSSSGVSFSLYKQYSCIEPFKVKLTCIFNNNSLNLDVHYDTHLFSADAIQRLSREFQILLTSAIDNPDTLISHLEILTLRDRKQLLFEFNQTQVDYPSDKCIHQLFEEQVEKTPNNIAVVFEEQQLTYAELNTRANQLAHYLQKQGVEPEVLVGLCMERSLEMIVGLLGILKAGGAYLPLDPALPTSGLEFRLQDAQTKVLLTRKQLVKNLLEYVAQVICLDSDWEAIAKEDSENPSSEVRPEHLVYTIYTSGSTGKPKGVAVEHRQLLNYLYSIQDILNLPPGSSLANVSTLAADLGNTVIFPSLCSGGCLHVVSSERVADAPALANYFERYPIDCLKIVPSHLSALLASSPSESIFPHQLLILGGEAASWELIKQIQQQVPECQILNHYGPTEATIGTLTYTVKNRQASYGSQTVPLGRPLANTQVYVLDKQLRPLPFGVQGELYIGGAGLARGYLNRAEQTVERFIANPFLPESEALLYKTGDLVRYLPDGNLEFIGRVDHQVKIRGFRIELGEIEAVLSQHSEVQQAVVSVQEDELNNKRLVAYIVPNREQTFKMSDLRNFLREKLPQYMMPSAFVLLKALPITANGKVDRRTLPIPDSLRPELEAIYVPPRTEVEQTIAKIWQDMLHLEKVGINDNFFDLGGHSLLIIQVHSKLQKVLRRDISITDLFEYPTISSLTKYLSQEERETYSFEANNKRAENRIALRQSRMRTS